MRSTRAVCVAQNAHQLVNVSVVDENGRLFQDETGDRLVIGTVLDSCARCQPRHLAGSMIHKDHLLGSSRLPFYWTLHDTCPTLPSTCPPPLPGPLFRQLSPRSLRTLCRPKDASTHLTLIISEFLTSENYRESDEPVPEKFGLLCETAAGQEQMLAI